MKNVKIFALKSLSGNPADGIDNVNIGIFSNISSDEVNYFVETPENLLESGSIKKIDIKYKSSILKLISKIILMRKIKPNYLLGRGALNEIFFAVLKPRKTKYIIGWHTLLLKKSGAWKVKTPWFLRKMIFSMSDLIIAVSSFSANSVKKLSPRKNILGIVNGVDVDFFNPKKKDPDYLKEKYNIDFSKPIISFIGTLQPRKRPDLVMSLAQSLQNINFVFVGKDFAPWHFGEKIKQIKNALWISNMPREDIATLLSSSDLFIFPSLNETCAAVIIEAMASGIPSVVSKSGGNIEMVRDKLDGALISTGENEKENFQKAINNILNNPITKITMGENARKRAEDNFSWKSVAQKYKQVFFDYI